ncbi:MAG: MarR family transcriptional regulator, partial [Pseudomonadota bacterium]
MTDPTLAILFDRLMRRLHVSMMAKAQEFDAHRVGPAGAMLLMSLKDLGPVETHTLVKEAARDKSQITRLLNTLEQKGIIIRTQSKRDARAQVISLTEAGEELVKAHQKAVGDALAEELAPLSHA